MTYSNSQGWIVARKSSNNPVPTYYRSYQKWLADPRKCAHLTEQDAQEVIKRLAKRQSQYGNDTFAIVRMDMALQLFKLQFGKRRGDTRSLPGPDEAGSHTLTAQ